MGSDCVVHLHGVSPSAAGPIARDAEAEVRRIEAKYSRYRPDSELSRLNAVAATGGAASIDPETRGLIAFAQACHHKSDGAFDVTSGLLRSAWDLKRARLPAQAALNELLPRIGLDKVTLSDAGVAFGSQGMELDFGGLGKEYAADRAAEICLELGVRHGFVDFGGDIRVIGPQPDGQPWLIGIRDPSDPDLLVAEVRVESGALATSGDYEHYIEVEGRRYSHILDPRTGWPSRGLSSVTVITDRCLVAGSLATSAMVKGEDGPAWLRGLGVRHILVDDRGQRAGTEPLSSRP
ncbi:MAG: FAD:protein FMN transferase [Phenylobacterium sp.]|nr:MAG: FAD:protein FMN transferase [Phenylobacterium sp.]